MAAKTYTRRQVRRNSWIAALLALAAVAALSFAFYGGHRSPSCHSRWEHSAAHSYQSFADYQTNVCNGVPLPAPADPADLPSN